MSKFEQLIRNKTMKGQVFLAILTNDPYEAVRVYIEKTGYEPTILLVRPDFVLRESHPLIARSRHSAWGLILVSHLIKPSEIDDADPSIIYRERELEIDNALNLKKPDYSIPVHGVGRPERPKAICPHCHGKITDFESLGYWYGWSLGITPPYWEELRLYIFKRDNYTCQRCGKKFPPILLNAHHVNRKEDGGEDGAKNLQTLCQDCHAENKPVFEIAPE